MFNRYIALITRFPKATLLLLLALVIVAAAGLPNFKLDASSDSLTLEHDADLDFYREVTKSYNSGDFLVVTFRPEKPLFTADSLDLLKKLRDRLADVEGVVSINSILDVPLLYSPKQSLTELVDNPRNLLTPGMDYEMAKQEFLTSPAYKDLILGPDAQTTAMQLNLAVDTHYLELVQGRDALTLKAKTEPLSIEEHARLEKLQAELLAYRTEAANRDHERVEEIRNIVSEYRDHAQIFVGGLTMITSDMISFIQSDLVVFGSAVLVFMILVLAVIFRSARFVLIPMATCVAAVVIMLGYVSWIDWRLTVISSNFIALLLIISLAIIIHLVVRYREFVEAHADWSQRERVVATLKTMALPCLYGVLTSVVAFMSLVVSNIRPVIDFGWLMTMGLILAFVLSFTLLPAALMVFKPRAKTKSTAATSHPPLTLYFSKAVEKYGNTILVITLLLTAVSVWGITRLQVENRFIDYFHDSTEIYQGLSVIDSELGGTTSLDIVLNYDDSTDTQPQIQAHSDEEDPFGDADSFGDEDPFATLPSDSDTSSDALSDDPFASDPFAETDPFSEHGEIEPSFWMTVAGLNKIERIHDYLDSLPEVGKVQSLAVIYKIGQDINGSLNDFELALLQKNLPRTIRSAMVAPYLSAENDQTRITLRVHDGYPGLQRAELVERIHHKIVDEGWVKDENLRFSGLLVLYNNMLQSLFSSQISTLGTVMLGIFIMFVVLFRSLKVALVGIVPTVVAALAILGFMGIFGLPLDMMTITVAAITVGIGVDDTIHYIHRFKHELNADGDYIASMHRAHESTGRAMFYTSVIIIFGFGIMVLSEFIPTIYFGLLTGLAMFFALLGALLVLPQLILLVKPFGKPAVSVTRYQQEISPPQEKLA